MSIQSTYYAVPVTVDEGLTATVGQGIGVMTSALFHTALALAADKGTVIAVWKFRHGVRHEEATILAAKVQPTKLMIVNSEDYGLLELKAEYAFEVHVLEAPPLN